MAMEKEQKNGVSPRERLHKIIDIVDDDKVNALLTLFQDLEEEEGLTYTEGFVAELDQEYDSYLKGNKTYSREEVKIHTQDLLESLRSQK